MSDIVIERRQSLFLKKSLITSDNLLKIKQQRKLFGKIIPSQCKICTC